MRNEENQSSLHEVFGEPISVYTREQAIEDGVLVDVSRWAGPDQMRPGYLVPVCFTRKLWERVDVEGPEPWRKRLRARGQDTRGRAHDVLWMALLALRAQTGEVVTRDFRLSLPGPDRFSTIQLRAVVDRDGVTIGLADDEW